MLKGVGVIFLIYLFFEIYLTVELGASVGGFNIFLEVILSAIVGFFIVSNFKNSLAESMSALSKMRIEPNRAISSTLLSLVGGVMLIVPGIISDTVGLLLQFSIFSTIITNRFSKDVDIKYDYREKNSRNYTKEEDIIDVEIIDKSDKHSDSR